jgi:hypothetical protein
LNVRFCDIDFSEWLSHNSFGRDVLSLFVGFSLKLIVFTNSGEEGLSRGGKFKMFYSNVDSLGDNSLSDLFVDLDSDGSGIDIEDSSCAAMIVFVGHTLMNSSVHHNINDITDFVGSECLGNVNSSVLFETFFEFVSGFTFVSV